MDSAGNLQIADVMMAKRRIQDYARVTPLIRAEGLEKLFGGAEVWLKPVSYTHLLVSVSTTGVRRKGTAIVKLKMIGNPNTAISLMLNKTEGSATCAIFV